MPRVTPAHRDARRAQILSAARRCFHRQGFHATTMQDLFAEAGLSAGAVYGYFDSKDELIRAIAVDNMRNVIDRFTTIARQESDQALGDLLAGALEVIRSENESEGLAGLAVQVWAEALRNESLRDELTRWLDGLHDDLVTLIRDTSARAGKQDAAGTDGLAGVLLAIIPGYLVQLALRGEGAVDNVPAAVRELCGSFFGSDRPAAAG